MCAVSASSSQCPHRGFTESSDVTAVALDCSPLCAAEIALWILPQSLPQSPALNVNPLVLLLPPDWGCLVGKVTF